MVEKYFEGDNLVLINDCDNSNWVIYNKDNMEASVFGYDYWWYSNIDLFKHIETNYNKDCLFELFEYMIDSDWVGEEDKQEIEEYLEDRNYKEEFNGWYDTRESEE